MLSWLGLFFVRSFWLLIQSLYLLQVYSDFKCSFESVSVVYVFLGICLLHLNHLFCWCTGSGSAIGPFLPSAYPLLQRRRSWTLQWFFLWGQDINGVLRTGKEGLYSGHTKCSRTRLFKPQRWRGWCWRHGQEDSRETSLAAAMRTTLESEEERVKDFRETLLGNEIRWEGLWGNSQCSINHC